VNHAGAAIIAAASLLAGTWLIISQYAAVQAEVDRSRAPDQSLVEIGSGSPMAASPESEPVAMKVVNPIEPDENTEALVSREMADRVTIIDRASVTTEQELPRSSPEL
jgi:hypothetical protein